MAYNIIFDIDQTTADTSYVEEARDNRNWEFAINAIDTGEIGLFHGLVDLINEARSKGHNIIFVSSSARKYCEHVLKRLGLEDYPLIAYQDTKKHKPDPEPYLLAMQRYGKPGMGYVIVGDSLRDIEAANRIQGKTIFAMRSTWGIPKEKFDQEDEEKRSKAIPFMLIEKVADLRDFIFYDWSPKIDESTGDTYCFSYYPIGAGRYTDYYSLAFFRDIKGKNIRIKSTHPIFSKKWVIKWAVKYLTKYIRTVKKENGITDTSKIGLFIVPSSTAGKWNAALEHDILPEVIEKTGASNFLTVLERYKSRESAHIGNDRSISTNLDTIRIKPEDSLRMGSLEIAIVLDDITTSGNTFEACRSIIRRDAGTSFKGKILCAAIAKTKVPSSSLEDIFVDFPLSSFGIDENEPFY